MCSQNFSPPKSALREVTFSKSLSGAVIDTVDDNSLLLTLHAKDDSVREVDEMADLEGELFLLRDYRTALRQVFERIDRLDKSAKPPFCGLRFLFDITDEPNVVLGIDQCRFCDVNLKCQASPEVLPMPAARA